MKTKYFLLVLICGVLLYSCSKQKTVSLKSKVNNLVSEYNAIDDWEYNLTSGISLEFTTFEKNQLWELWSVNRPILFYGRIKETQNYDDLHYLLIFDRNTLVNFKYYYYPEIQLSFIYPKDKFDAFVEQHPDFYDNYGFNNSIAVIADIVSISSETEFDEEGDEYDILLGHGNMRNMIYLGSDYL